MPRLFTSEPLPSIPGVSGLTPLASGGQGDVFVGAWHDGRKVAVRVEPLTEVEDATARLRADQEGTLLARLAHPNLVPLLAHGTTAHATYVVMEFVEGADLSRELARRADRPDIDAASTQTRASRQPTDPTAAATRILDAATQAALAVAPIARPASPEAFRNAEHWRWVATLGVQLCGALDRLHSAGFLHRDITPRNVMVRPDGSVVLVDLGLATAGDLVRIASDDSVAGTWAYMSPEQRRREGISTRSDIYGLGCTLYECLTGHPPGHAVAGTTEYAPPPDVRDSNPTVPEAFALALGTCLRPVPGERYVGARDLGDDLLAVLAGRPLGWRQRHWSRRRIAVASVTLAVALAGVTWWVARSTPPPPPWTAALAAVRAGDLAAATAAVDAAPDRADTLARIGSGLHPEEVEPQRWLARLQGFGLLETQPSPRIAVAICESDLEFTGTVETWYSADKPLAFTRPPGLYKLVVAMASPGSKPASGDERMTTAPLLFRVDPNSPVSVACAEIVSAWDRHPGRDLGWYRLPGGGATIRHAAGLSGSTEFVIPPRPPLDMARTEIPAEVFHLYVDWLRFGPATRVALFAHPDEPEAACTLDAALSLRTTVIAPRGARAEVSFWWAHRIAGFLGGRMPTAADWNLAAQTCYLEDGQSRDRESPAIRDLLDGAREWTCTASPFGRDGNMLCPLHPPSSRGAGGNLRLSGSRLVIGHDDINPILTGRAAARVVRILYTPSFDTSR